MEHHIPISKKARNLNFSYGLEERKNENIYLIEKIRMSWRLGYTRWYRVEEGNNI